MQRLNVFDLIAAHHTLRPDNIAVIDGRQQITYGQLHDQVESLARKLSSLGVKPGDRVAIYLNKSVEEILVLFAVAV